MTPEQWQEIKDVLGRALELDPDRRITYLDAACAGNADMRTELDSLLRSYEEDSSFLSVPPAEAFVTPASLYGPSRFVGSRFGAYELLGVIAEGGMGTVYRAQRADGLYDKQVAIKIIRAELAGPFFVSHFDMERRILAQLEHPNIARLIDGGITSEGLPFLVLEYIHGTPIDQYCEVHELSIPKRLELFRSVCAAVQYAHQNLVVHRDLKPPNILVTPEGVPKLLDFGVAKALDPEQVEAPGSRTVAMLRILTPDFASPEQVRGESINIASDVYSLGVVLYLLLTGELPYRIPGTGPQQVIDTVCKVIPKRPSAVMVGIGEKTESAENSYKLLRAKLARTLRGDLDCILLKALRKEPDQRYATAAELSDDIGRYLAQVPVRARKGTNVYLLSRFLMRNRIWVTAAAILLVVVVTGAAIILREGYLAQRRFNDLRRLANSLIFEIHDSIKDLPGSTPARKLIVDRALQYLDNLSKETPRDISLQRELTAAYERVGQVQGLHMGSSLGDVTGSLVTLNKSLSIRQRIAARTKDPSDLLALAHDYRLVAGQQQALGDIPRARESIGSAVRVSEALNQLDPGEWETLSELARDYQTASDVERETYTWSANDASQRDAYGAKAMAVDETLLRMRPHDPEALNAYGDDLSSMGYAVRGTNLQQSLKYFQSSLEVFQKLHVESPEMRYAGNLAIAYEEVADIYDRLHDDARALENDSHSLDIMKNILNADPRNVRMRHSTAISYINTAIMLRRVGRHSESVDDTRESLELEREAVASDAGNQNERGFLAEAAIIGAFNFLGAGHTEEAMSEFNEGCAIFEMMEQAHPGDATRSDNLILCDVERGQIERQAGNFALAGTFFHRALDRTEHRLGAEKKGGGFWAAAASTYSALGDLSRSLAQHDQGTELQYKSFTDGQSWYLKSLAAWQQAGSILNTEVHNFEVDGPREVSRNLQTCRRQLAHLRTPSNSSR